LVFTNLMLSYPMTVDVEHCKQSLKCGKKTHHC
jgi:hypothetical protein